MFFLEHTLPLRLCFCRCRRPFHPKRLHAFLESHFTLQQPDWSSDASHGVCCDDINCTRVHPAPSTAGGRAAAAAAAPGSSSISSIAAALLPTPTTAAVGAPLPLLGQPLLRSRGFAWVAGTSRRDHCCEWSQAGVVITFGTGGPWYCVLPRYVPGGIIILGTGGTLVLRTAEERAGWGVVTFCTEGNLVQRTAEVRRATYVCPAVGLVLTERSLVWSSAPLGD